MLDAVLAQDPMGRVACETLRPRPAWSLVMGEITTSATIDIPHAWPARPSATHRLRPAGDAASTATAATCMIAMGQQSPRYRHGR
ncbi:MAG: hypothetical protein ACLU3I_05295 [Acutalibacteraceae bacterium]